MATKKSEETKTVGGVEVSKKQYKRIWIWIVIGLLLGVGLWYLRIKMGW